MPNAIRFLLVGWCVCNSAVASESISTDVELNLSDRGSQGRFSIVGSASCSATSCHGQVQLGNAAGNRSVGSEFQTWRQSDPHSRAGWKLGNPLSQQILRDLEIVRGDQIVDRDGLNNCLNCHAPETVKQANNFETRMAAISLSRGVGCESCHGNAEEWLAPHASREWSSMNHAKQGMFETKSLLVRARICADCHVGSPDRNVNHDLIAAGHPALRFEMSQYHNRLAKHWRETAQQSVQFQSHLWWSGQIATADVASLLLEQRARSEDISTSVWPELAEFNCAGCHQSSVANTKNQLTWGSWNHAVLPLLASSQVAHSQDASNFHEAYLELSSEMERLNRANRQRVAELAKSLRQHMNAWTAHRIKKTRPDSGDATRDQLIEIVQDKSLANSDQATQLFLAIVAMQRYRKNPLDETWRKDVNHVAELLRFPAQRELPDWPTTRSIDSNQSEHFLQDAYLRMLR